MNMTRRRVLESFAALALASAAGSAPAAPSSVAQARALVDNARETIADLAADKDFSGLRTSLAGARAVLVFPRVFSAGLVIGGAGGNGVLMVRNEHTGEWNGPVFYTLGGASVGLQAGAFNGSVAMVVRSEKTLDSLYKTSLKLGGDATFALGTKGGSAAGAAGADVIVYSKVKGAFAGVTVDGIVLKVRRSLNKAYYDKALSPAEMVLAPAGATPSADGLRQALRLAAG